MWNNKPQKNINCVFHIHKVLKKKNSKTKSPIVEGCKYFWPKYREKPEHQTHNSGSWLPLRREQSGWDEEGFRWTLKVTVGLPWWLSVKESAYQCRRHRFNPWSRKNPHAKEQRSPCARTTEPVPGVHEAQLPSPWATTTEAQARWSPYSTREATATRSPLPATKSSPHLPQLEKSPCSNKDPAPPKVNK